MKKIKKIQYTWQMFQKDIDTLVEILTPHKQYYKNIYGLPRGGLIPAVILSHKLEIPMIFDFKKINQHTLVVDDISDTGETLEKLLKKKKHITVVCLWSTLTTKVIPDYTTNIVEDNDWVVFPWELFKALPKKDT